jgi:hypothetical protein
MSHDDDESTAEQTEAGSKTTQPAPGPADHGGQGGMATREKAPELAEGHEAED